MSTPYPENPKFCKDCKWFEREQGFEEFEGACKNEYCFELCLVTGIREQKMALAARDSNGACGIEARYFEPKGN